MLNRAGAEAGHVHGPGCEHDHQGGTAGPADGITSPMNGTLEPPGGSNPSGSSAFAMDGNFPETSGSNSDVDDPSSTTTSSSEDSDGGGSSSSEDGGRAPPLR